MPAALTSLKGRLLLDGGRLIGSYFHRTVVLVCDHSAHGAFGLVLNRPSENILEDVVAEQVPTQIGKMRVFDGGPVQAGALSFLHAPGHVAQGNVLPGLDVGHDLEALRELSTNLSADQKLRVFGGYAGWAPGQLDNEIRQDAWLVERATLDLIFDVDPASLWRHVLKRRPRWQDQLLADAPEDMSWN